MSTAHQIVICAGIVPDPLQTLEPVASPSGPALKNEMMLPAVLDPRVAASRQSAANFSGRILFGGFLPKAATAYHSKR